MTLTHSQIAHHAGIVRDEAADLCALGAALSRERLQEGIGVLRLALAKLEGAAVTWEREETPAP